MKKILGGIATLTLGLALVGCGSSHTAKKVTGTKLATEYQYSDYSPDMMQDGWNTDLEEGWLEGYVKVNSNPNKERGFCILNYIEANFTPNESIALNDSERQTVIADSGC